MIDRLEREDLPSNHVHGILLTLCRIKQSVASGLFVLTANLLEKLVSSCKCPLISSQFISLVNMEDNLNQVGRPFDFNKIALRIWIFDLYLKGHIA